MFLLKLSACVEKCYIIFPLNTKLSFPKSASGRGVPGANKPKTEDPEPLIAAYMALLSLRWQGIVEIRLPRSRLLTFLSTR